MIEDCRTRVRFPPPPPAFAKAPAGKPAEGKAEAELQNMPLCGLSQRFAFLTISAQSPSSSTSNPVPAARLQMNTCGERPPYPKISTLAMHTIFRIDDLWQKIRHKRVLVSGLCGVGLLAILSCLFLPAAFKVLCYSGLILFVLALAFFSEFL